MAHESYERWTFRKNEETRLEAFGMKGLRKILRVSLTAKKTNEWVLSKTVRHCQSEEANILWSHHHLGNKGIVWKKK